MKLCSWQPGGKQWQHTAWFMAKVTCRLTAQKSGSALAQQLSKCGITFAFSNRWVSSKSSVSLVLSATKCQLVYIAVSVRYWCIVNDAVAAFACYTASALLSQYSTVLSGDGIFLCLTEVYSCRSIAWLLNIFTACVKQFCGRVLCRVMLILYWCCVTWHCKHQ